MPKGRIVFTASGERLITEAYPDCCADGDEISAVENVDVPKGTLCDICKEEIA